MIAAMVLDALQKLRARTRKLGFSAPVAHVYRPLDYAWPMVEAYVSRFARGPKEVLFLGMNPGPFGMAQTGVPFGDVVSVRDWMKLDAKVTAPRAMHPKRPVLGLDCPRVEVSGRRLWGAVALRHPEPETFFSRAWVMNYCPLLFLAESGANLTPDKLQRSEREACEAICDRALREVIDSLAPSHLVGVGVYAKARLERAKPGGSVVLMPHPSPASPKANAGWVALAKTALEAGGIHGLL
jgi:single-strand selective monofunctional uracil DNA glycosylase